MEFQRTSVVWEGTTVGGESHVPYVENNPRIKWADVRNYFRKEPDYEQLRAYGFPEGRQTRFAGGMETVEFKREKVEAWLQRICSIADTVKVK